jgi:adrenodoxin-NADP+ reductase
MVLLSIGYQSRPLEGLPFDHAKGLIPNTNGRVEPGIYACGWVRRGPSGIIGTNKFDAESVVHAIQADVLGKQEFTSAPSNPSPFSLNGTPIIDPPLRDIKETLKKKNIETVSFEQWQLIDQEELRRGKVMNKIRDKIPTSSEMMSFIKTNATL